MEKYIMALDAGTTSNRAILFDKNGKIVSLSMTQMKYGHRCSALRLKQWQG